MNDRGLSLSATEMLKGYLLANIDQIEKRSKMNASLGDRDFDYKVEQYIKENLLAKSLHHKCYENNPGFQHMIETTGLPFRFYSKTNREEQKSVFRKVDLEERFQLYRQIAEQLWSVERLR